MSPSFNPKHKYPQDDSGDQGGFNKADFGSSSDQQRQLVLNRGKEKYIIRYRDGSEVDLLDTFIDMAQDPRTDFNLFDAAALSFKLTHNLFGPLEKELDPDGETLPNEENPEKE